jgi:hypothetical protein
LQDGFLLNLRTASGTRGRRCGGAVDLERDEFHDEVEHGGREGFLVDHDEFLRCGVHLEGFVERDGGSDVELGSYKRTARESVSPGRLRWKRQKNCKVTSCGELFGESDLLHEELFLALGGGRYCSHCQVRVSFSCE